MTPLWSSFPRPIVDRLSGIAEYLAKEGFVIFAVTEDDPLKNPLMAEWIRQHDRRDIALLPSVATGGGCLVACYFGKPIAIQSSTWDWTAEKLLDWIKSNRPNKSADPTAGNAPI
jgi:hypothetical protein